MRIDSSKYFQHFANCNISMFCSQFVALCGSKKANWSVKWFDELYLACNTLLQYHYIRNTGTYLISSAFESSYKIICFMS